MKYKPLLQLNPSTGRMRETSILANQISFTGAEITDHYHDILANQMTFIGAESTDHYHDSSHQLAGYKRKHSRKSDNLHWNRFLFIHDNKKDILATQLPSIRCKGILYSSQQKRYSSNASSLHSHECRQGIFGIATLQMQTKDILYCVAWELMFSPHLRVKAKQKMSTTRSEPIKSLGLKSWKPSIDAEIFCDG